jgi:glycosyltransferase involved in cell wall biosynthesis
MKVCLVLEAAGGGAGRHVLDLAAGLRARGDETTVIYSGDRAEPAFLEGLRSLEGVRAAEVPMRRGVGPRDAASLWTLGRTVRRLGPFDVLHGHSSKAGALVRLLRPFLPRSTRIVYTPHAFATMNPSASRIYGALERLLEPLGDAVIVLSDEERRHASGALGLPDRKVRLVHNGVASGGFAPRAAARRTLGFREEDVVLGFVGRLTAQKDPLRLVRAFAAARRSRPALRLAVAGDGELRAAAEALARASVPEGAVRFLGRRDARELMAGFDALAVSSGYEGMPYVFLEALAAGTPILTTPVGGARECAEEGVSGLVAAGFGDEALAGLFERVADDAGLRARLRAGAAGKAAQFTLAAMVDGTRRVYGELI